MTQIPDDQLLPTVATIGERVIPGALATKGDVGFILLGMRQHLARLATAADATPDELQGLTFWIGRAARAKALFRDTDPPDMLVSDAQARAAAEGKSVRVYRHEAA